MTIGTVLAAVAAVTVVAVLPLETVVTVMTVVTAVTVGTLVAGVTEGTSGNVWTLVTIQGLSNLFELSAEINISMKLS